MLPALGGALALTLLYRAARSPSASASGHRLRQGRAHVGALTINENGETIDENGNVVLPPEPGLIFNTDPVPTDPYATTADPSFNLMPMQTSQASSSSATYNAPADTSPTYSPTPVVSEGEGSPIFPVDRGDVVTMRPPRDPVIDCDDVLALLPEPQRSTYRFARSLAVNPEGETKSAKGVIAELLAGTFYEHLNPGLSRSIAKCLQDVVDGKKEKIPCDKLSLRISESTLRAYEITKGLVTSGGSDVDADAIVDNFVADLEKSGMDGIESASVASCLHAATGRNLTCEQALARASIEMRTAFGLAVASVADGRRSDAKETRDRIRRGDSSELGTNPDAVRLALARCLTEALNPKPSLTSPVRVQRFPR